MPESYFIKLGLFILFLLCSSQVKSQTNDYKIGICCFSANHAALRSKSKDWLTRNQDNVSEWGGMSIHRLVSVR